MNRLRRWSIVFPGLFLLAVTTAHADRIILKNGKVYYGHIMGETSTQILISSTPADPQPHFVQLYDVLTIVHEGPPPAPSPTRDQLITLETLLTGQFFSSSKVSIDPTAALHVAGGLRPIAAIEVGVETNWTPAQTGDTAISDGTTTREYTRFDSWSGGFYAKVFPAYRYRDLRWQPYVIGGYLWNRLQFKATTDDLKGSSVEGGAGVSYLLTRHVSIEARFVYERTRYDSVSFLLREGSLTKDVDVTAYRLSTGIVYRFL